MNINDITGQKFNYLTAVCFEYKVPRTDKSFRYFWRFKCDCGKEIIVERGGVTGLNARRKSCGCKSKRGKHLIRHALYKTTLYSIYSGMKRRCYSKNDPAYQFYGKKGIVLCDEWKTDFKTFFDWANVNGYQEGLTIERLNIYKNYEPSNCIFIPFEKQACNRTNTIWVTLNGKKMCLMEACKLLNLPYPLTRQRIRRDGWSIEKALYLK